MAGGMTVKTEDNKNLLYRGVFPGIKLDMLSQADEVQYP